MRAWADVHLLVCDDDASVRLAVRTFLTRQLGCTVTECASGYDALEVIQQRETHGVILDLQMPELDGLQTLQILQKLPTPPPVLVLTDDRRETMVRQALALGACDYLGKPPKPDALVNRVRRMMTRYEWRQTPVG